MQILEQQTLILHDLIDCKSSMKREQLPQFIAHITENIGSLGVRQTGKLLFTEHSESGEQTVELLIPVDHVPESCEHYTVKPMFRLIHAVSARHEGDLLRLQQTEQRLREHITAHGYQIITAPYYRVIRMEPDSTANAILDIYIGVNYNIL